MGRDVALWSAHEPAETFLLRNRPGDRQQALAVWKEALEIAERKGLTKLSRRIGTRLHRESTFSLGFAKCHGRASFRASPTFSARKDSRAKGLLS